MKENFLSVVLIYLGKFWIQSKENCRQHLSFKGCYNGKRSFFSVRRLKQRKTAPCRAAGTLGASVCKPHRVQCSTVSVPQSKPLNFRNPIRTARSNKRTSALTQPFNTGTAINMPLGPIHYPTLWFSAAFVFPTSSTSEPQSARATFPTVACFLLYLRQLVVVAAPPLLLNSTQIPETRSSVLGPELICCS